MKVFLSQRFLDKKKTLSERLARQLDNQLDQLNVLTRDEVLKSQKTKQIDSPGGNLLMFNAAGTRLFASIASQNKEDVLLILDVQAKEGSPRYLHLLDDESLKWEVDSIVANTQYDIVNDDAVVSEIATTNAVGWGVDEYEIDNIEKQDDDSVTADVLFHLTGEQDEDRPYNGTEITVHANVTIYSDGKVEYNVADAEIEHDDPDSSE